MSCARLPLERDSPLTPEPAYTARCRDPFNQLEPASPLTLERL